MDSVLSTTLAECVGHCAQNHDCTGADWTHSDGTCHLKGPQTFSSTASPVYDQWKVLGPRTPRCPQNPLTAPKDESQVQVVDLPQCPGGEYLYKEGLENDLLISTDNGNLFTTDDGAYWTLLCCTHNLGITELLGTRDIVPSRKACATKCSTTSGCQRCVRSAIQSQAEILIYHQFRVFIEGK